MKRINIIISALAISVLAASCAKESPSKSEVEAGFPNRFQGEIPEVSFSAEKPRSMTRPIPSMWIQR